MRPLTNHAPRAAEKMIELGARPDVLAAAGLGRMDLLRACFDGDGRLRSRPRRRGKAMAERDAIGLAMLFAYVRKQHDAVGYLLEKDGNWNMIGVNNGPLLHRQRGTGICRCLRRLVAKGADVSNRDNPFDYTPLAGRNTTSRIAWFNGCVSTARWICTTPVVRSAGSAEARFGGAGFGQQADRPLGNPAERAASLGGGA